MSLYKLIITYALAVCSIACTSTVSTDNQISELSYDRQEEVYKNTYEYTKLVNLYKERLIENDLIDTRLKLIETYIAMNDIESAEFSLNMLGSSSNYQSQIDYLYAQVNYEKSYYGTAAIYAKSAIERRGNFEQAENLLGLIYATLGDYEQAKHYFYLARQHLADDVKIKNNLAVVDILEGNYQQAAYRLEPLIVNGIRDEQVISNLALVYAKTDNFESFTALHFDSGVSVEELQQAFYALKSVESHSGKKEGDRLNGAKPELEVSL
ncbi:hypothetical protein [Vibrio sp. qd031]|uniref:hypothetical protein n=1 Tax=Vibrio sp. qd031 TaxID=1603038 RepID=UPI000A1213D2|nr:hypothetical protein [Vibrio sp. qd031]